MLFRNEGELLALAEIVFDQFDEERLNSLDALGFKYAVKALYGVVPSKAEINGLLSGNSSSPTPTSERRVKREKFVSFVLDKRFLYGTEDTTWALFDALDEESKGYVSFDDMRRAARSTAELFPAAAAAVAPPWSDESVLRGLFSRLDRDRTGRILLSDFAQCVVRTS